MNSQILNWPDGIERTPPEDRTDTSKFSKGFRDTKSQLKGEMRRLGVERWNLDDVTGSGGDPGVVVRWTIDGIDHAVACDKFTTKGDNLRETYLWINETRMRKQREAQTAKDAFAAAQLPSGDNEAIVTSLPAHTILGVDSDATADEVDAAFRRLSKIHHPDHGGDEETFREIKRARARMKG